MTHSVRGLGLDRNNSSTPRCGSGPKCCLEAPPPPPPCALRPLPPTSLGRPLPEPCKKSQGGWGEEGRRGRGGKGFGLREGSSNYNGGRDGDPPNTSWGQTHIWGLPPKQLRWHVCRVNFARKIFSSESKCHFRGVISCRVPGALPLHKRNGILLPPGAFRGAFQKNDACFPLFCCVCDL